MNGLETKFALREEIKQNHPKKNLGNSAGDLGSYHAKFSAIHLLLPQNFPHPLSLFLQPLPRKISTYKLF